MLKVKFEVDEKDRWIGVVFLCCMDQKKDPKWHCPKANGQTQRHKTGIQLCEKGMDRKNPLRKEKRGLLSVPGSHYPAGLLRPPSVVIPE
jgi:hypothetical protein